MDHELHDKSDMYGLGATLYNVLMLETPWHFLTTITELYANRLEQNDPKYKQEKEHRRAEVRNAILQEISEHRQRVTQSVQNPNQPTEDRPAFIPTILQENLATHYTDKQSGQIIVRAYPVFQMLMHDSNLRPSCDEVESFFHVYLKPRAGAAALDTQQSTSSSSSDDSSGPVFLDSETLRTGPLPAVIHNSMSHFNITITCMYIFFPYYNFPLEK